MLIGNLFRSSRFSIFGTGCFSDLQVIKNQRPMVSAVEIACTIAHVLSYLIRVQRKIMYYLIIWLLLFQ